MHTSTEAPLRLSVRFTALGAAMLALVGLSMGSASPAFAHDELVGTSPVGSVESGDAPGLQLDFNNEVMHIGSEMIGEGADGSNLLEGVPIIEGRSVTQHLVEGLPDGDYRVAWRVVSSDGHPIQGLVTVTMQGGYPTSVVPADPNATIDDAAADDTAAEAAAESASSADTTESAEASTTADAAGDGTSQTQANGSGTLIAGSVAVIVIAAGAIGLLIFSAQKRKKTN